MQTKVTELVSKDIVAQNIMKSGVLLLRAGTEITPRLKHLLGQHGVREVTIHVGH